MDPSRTDNLTTKQNKLKKCTFRLWHSALWHCVDFCAPTNDSEKYSNSIFRVKVNMARVLNISRKVDDQDRGRARGN
jgi:hypothetical protein